MRRRVRPTLRAPGTVAGMRRPLLLALAALATLALLPTGASAETATCHGLPVTTTKSKGLIVGTPKRDVIRLTGRGVVRSRGGDDVICGSRFADRINTGTGNDVVLGGRGADRIRGGLGADRLFGEAGNDWIDGGPGRNTIIPGAGRNTVVPQKRRDRATRQFLPMLNTVVPGTFAVSIVLPPQGTAQLLQGGMEIGLSRVTQANLIPVAATSSPLQYTGFTLGEYGVSTSAGPLVPGASPMTLQMKFTTLGSVWSVNQEGLLTPAEGSGTPTGVTVQSAYQGLMSVGLAQDIAPFGSPPSFDEILYATLDPFETATLVPPPTVAVFATERGSAGTLLFVLPPSTAIDRVTRTNPTAAFSWSPQEGRFITD